MVSNEKGEADPFAWSVKSNFDNSFSSREWWGGILRCVKYVKYFLEAEGWVY